MQQQQHMKQKHDKDNIKQIYNINNNINIANDNNNNEAWYIKNKCVLECYNCGQLRDLRFYDIEWKEYQQFINNAQKKFYCEYYDARQPSPTVSEVEYSIYELNKISKTSVSTRSKQYGQNNNSNNINFNINNNSNQ